VWLHRVKQVYGERLDITWKHFSLEQVNSDNGPEWKVWDQPDTYSSKSLVALRAGEAARRQGAEAFERFHLDLLTARHGGNGRISLDQIDPLLAVAGGAGLDAGRLRQDMADPALLDSIARDHTDAVERLGVFGTPTFVFENGGTAYLKLFIPPPDDSIAFFEHFVAIAAQRQFVGELKRPQPPWPKGALE
jgi:predicted DsbA family dithiol-disulfide isomerase